jgi:hypothetical protein
MVMSQRYVAIKQESPALIGFAVWYCQSKEMYSTVSREFKLSFPNFETIKINAFEM